MSTSKTVNVTTGKVLNYTVSKTGYKTVHGSKLITGSDTITVNMVSSEAPAGPYVFGDRIGGIATFFTYFDSINPDTSVAQRYAVFILDAQYRMLNGSAVWTEWGRSLNANLPEYATSDLAKATMISATYATNYIIDNFGSSAPAFYYARNPGGNPLSIQGGYVPQLINAAEANAILNVNMITALDKADPTVSTYSTASLANLLRTHNGFWTSTQKSKTEHTYGTAWNAYREGNSSFSLHATRGADGNNVVSVFEIPVNY